MSNEDDPLTRALHEAQSKKAADKQWQRAQRQKAEAEVDAALPHIKQQVVSALRDVRFFDAGTNESATDAPVVVNESEGSVVAHRTFAVVARRNNPPYQATITVSLGYTAGVEDRKPTWTIDTDGRLAKMEPVNMRVVASQKFDPKISPDETGTLTLNRDLLVANLTNCVTVLER